MRISQLVPLGSVPVVFLVGACQTTEPNRFDHADVNRDGALTRDEANTYLVTEIFDGRDADKDGKITQAEWVVGSDPAQMRQFQERDANRDGIVTRDEAIAHGRRKGMANQLVHTADTNKDGSLSRAEVTAYYGSKEGPH